MCVILKLEMFTGLVINTNTNQLTNKTKKTKTKTRTVIRTKLDSVLKGRFNKTKQNKTNQLIEEVQRAGGSKQLTVQIVLVENDLESRQDSIHSLCAYFPSISKQTRLKQRLVTSGARRCDMLPLDFATPVPSKHK